MVTRKQIRLDSDGMDEALSRDETQRALQSQGEDIADVAQANMPTHYTGPLGYDVDTKVGPWFGKHGKKRALTFVRTSHQLGPALERKYAPLRNAARRVGLWMLRRNS